MPKYRVSYYYRDWSDEDATSLDYTVDAQSGHEAIGTAWGLMKNDVEMYGGTIDDLDAYEIPNEEETERWRLAHIIYRAVTLEESSAFVALQDKEPWYRAADQMIMRGK